MTTTRLLEREELTEASSTPPARRTRALAPGDRVGSYVIGEVLAQGGCATVYTAEHQILARRVAVKVLRSELVNDREMVERFFREARAVNLISHPNIVDIHDIGTLPGLGPYLVMELLEGVTLDQAVRRSQRFTPRELLPILEAIGDALSAAHEHGIVHRDLKGSNIFLATGRNGERIVKLLDFGVAKLFGGPGDLNLTTAHRRLGTPTYMAPEQFRCDPVDCRTDVYALGATVFFLLTGRPPFIARTMLEVERMHLEQAPPRVSEHAAIGTALDDVLRKAMAKQPADRFATVGELVRAFAAALVDAPEVAASPCFAALAMATTSDELALLDYLDAVEDLLCARGLTVALRAGAACLAVRTCGDGDAHIVATLVDELRRVAAAHPDVAATVAIKRGMAVVTAEGASGPLLEYARWAPRSASTGIHVDDELAGYPAGTSPDGFRDFTTAPAGR